jgi:hypothetical protein
MTIRRLVAARGGDGSDESFIVNGLWSVNGTSTPGTPNSDSDTCRQIANAVGKFPGTTLDVVQQDGTVTATEVGSSLAFAGTVNESNQSFTFTAMTPQCQTRGSCTVCVTAGADFVDAGGDTADVNLAFAATGNAGCPGQCTLVYSTTATRS